MKEYQSNSEMTLLLCHVGFTSKDEHVLDCSAVFVRVLYYLLYGDLFEFQTF